MQQRAEPHDSLDDFPTPPWATRALCNWIARNACDGRLGQLDVREPCANRGHMVRPLREYFGHVQASDVHDYGAGFLQRDYLFPGGQDHHDWTFMNPPFRLAQEFILQAKALSRQGAAALVRTSFLEGVERCDELFTPHPPAYVLQFAERVVMHKGVLRRPGSKYIGEDGKLKTASTATSYAWLVWLKDRGTLDGWLTDTRFRVIPKCRTELERAGDYPEDVAGLANLELAK